MVADFGSPYKITLFQILIASDSLIKSMDLEEAAIRHHKNNVYFNLNSFRSFLLKN